MINKKKILVVGQTPPPYGGQAIMIDYMLKSEYQKIEFYHARMTFSNDMKEVGKFKISKLWQLANLICKVYFLKIRHNISILYYPPAGPEKIPMFRDIVILNATRWMFKEVIFHFHAAGISEMYPKLDSLLRKLFKRAYFHPDLAIRLSLLNPEDGKGLLAKREVIVPNGIKDEAKQYLPIFRKQDKIPNILFVGALIESKGVLVLLEAVKILVERDLKFHVQLMGRFKSDDFREKVNKYIKSHRLSSRVKFLGVCIGKEKHKAFLSANMLCFPTYFESETFGLVLLEAMQFELPVITTKWRGIPDLVKDCENGLLVPTKDACALSCKLAYLIHNPEQRTRMGKIGREVYLEKYSVNHFSKKLDEVLS